MKTAPTVAPAHRQRGVTLLEALIAFLVLALGILTIGRVQTHLRLGSDIARQRSEAVRLGQEDLEAMRAFAVIAASAEARSYADIASASSTIDGAHGYASNTQYVLTRNVQPSATNDAKSMAVTVVWYDRSGAHQRVVLNSIIAGNDPMHSAALSLPPNGAPVKGAHGRAAFIPLQAKNLGNGSSAIKPAGSGAIAYVFDNATGLVVSRCTAVDPTIATRDLTTVDLAGCDAATGRLLSGIVRFALGASPDPGHASDAPLALSVALAPSTGVYPLAPSCASEALKTVSYGNPGALRVESVALAATPASLGLSTWTESGDRYVAYHCVVYPPASGQWSGRTTLVPSGWALGVGATDRRVCRCRRQRCDRRQRRASRGIRWRVRRAREPEFPRRRRPPGLPRRQRGDDRRHSLGRVREPGDGSAPALTRRVILVR